MRFRKILAFCCLIIVVSSCEKELTGPKGVDGEAGVSGEPGDDYSLYSKDFVVDSADWNVTSFGGFNDEFNYYFNDSNLTLAIIENSLILLYIKGDDGKYPLPHRVISSEENVSFTYRVEQGRIEVEYKYLGGILSAPRKRNFELVILEETN